MRFIFSAVIYSLLAIALFCGPVKAAEIPPIVKKHFEAYVASHPQEKERSSEYPLEQLFADSFFMGLTRQYAVWAWQGIDAYAYNLGQSYWRDNPNEREIILASFGYVRAEAQGVWRCGFEQSDFIPEGQKTEMWWVSSFRGASKGKSANSNCNKSRTVRIVGYLSPTGSYGHLGIYQREAFFTSFTILK